MNPKRLHQILHVVEMVGAVLVLGLIFQRLWQKYRRRGSGQ